ncbi:MAG: hypothetical protein WC404_00010, partial [Candidatus Omnitrophota bacterium]
SPKVGEGLKGSAQALINRMAAGKTLSPDMLREAKDVLFEMQFQEYANLLRTFKYNVWTYEFNGMLDVTYWNMISKNYRRLAQHVWPGDTMYLYGDLWSRGRLISLAQMLLTNDFTRDPRGATLQPSKRADEFVRFAEKLRTSVNNFNAEPYEIEFNNIVNSLIVSKGARAGQVVIVESSFKRLLELIEKGVRENLAGMVKIDFSELERLAGMCRSGINEGKISEQDKIALVVEAKNVMDQIQAGRMLSTAAFLVGLHSKFISIIPPTQEEVRAGRQRWLKLGLETYRVEVQKDGTVYLVPRRSRAGEKVTIKPKDTQLVLRGITYTLAREGKTLKLAPDLSKVNTVETMRDDLESIYTKINLIKPAVEEFLSSPAKKRTLDPRNASDFGALYYYAVEFMIKEEMSVNELKGMLGRMKSIRDSAEVLYKSVYGSDYVLSLDNPAEVGKLMALEKSMRYGLDDSGQLVEKTPPITLAEMNAMLRLSAIFLNDSNTPKVNNLLRNSIDARGRPLSSRFTADYDIKRDIMAADEALKQGDEDAARRIGETLGFVMGIAEVAIRPSGAMEAEVAKMPTEQRVERGQ